MTNQTTDRLSVMRSHYYQFRLSAMLELAGSLPYLFLFLKCFIGLIVSHTIKKQPLMVIKHCVISNIFIISLYINII